MIGLAEMAPGRKIRDPVTDIFSMFFSSGLAPSWAKAGLAPKIAVDATPKAIARLTDLVNFDFVNMCLSLNRDSVSNCRFNDLFLEMKHYRAKNIHHKKGGSTINHLEI
jgi:hypothetical protein